MTTYYRPDKPFHVKEMDKVNDFEDGDERIEVIFGYANTSNTFGTFSRDDSSVGFHLDDKDMVFFITADEDDFPWDILMPITHALGTRWEEEEEDEPVLSS